MKIEYKYSPSGVINYSYNTMRKYRNLTFDFKEMNSKFIEDEYFKELYDEWCISGFKKELKPTIKVRDITKPHDLDNLKVMRVKESRSEKRQYVEQNRGKVIQYENGVEIARYRTQSDAALATGIPQGSISLILRGMQNTSRGYTFEYDK